MTNEEAKRNLIYSKRWGVKPDDEALDMAIKALEQTRWIPVSEMLPKEVGTYLITLKDGDVRLCDFNPYCFADRISLSKVAIAWMPLPEPYKAESEVQE